MWLTPGKSSEQLVLEVECLNSVSLLLSWKHFLLEHLLALLFLLAMSLLFHLAKPKTREKNKKEKWYFKTINTMYMYLPLKKKKKNSSLPIDLTKKNKKQIIILLTLLGHYYLNFWKWCLKQCKEKIFIVTFQKKFWKSEFECN